MRSARLALISLVLFAMLVPATPAAAQDQVAVITSPKDGDQLTGVIQLLGTATHSRFAFYDLAWAPQSAPENWQMIATVQNRIVNGSLGTWDTAQLQPGVYRLRLRVVRDNDKTDEFIVNNLSINQGTPTPAASPTPPIGPTIPPSPTQGAAGATPTVAIVQPPTATPQPAATKAAAGSTTPPSGSRTPTIQINFGSFGQAFCGGALYAFLIFVIWGLVIAMRGIFRWGLRQARQSTVRRQ